MDPFLEGAMWPDVHNSLIYQIRQLIAPMISPGYIAKIEPYTAFDHEPDQDIGILYPDVAVLKRKSDDLNLLQEEDPQSYTLITPPSVTIPILQTPIEHQIPTLEIRDVSNNQLITVIEILSPINKRGKGLEQHLEKQQQLIEGQVHLIEIDLLRRGQRVINSPLLPISHYLVSLIRGGKPQRQIWAFNIQDALPTIPIPLKAPDKDVILNLNTALIAAYEIGHYYLSINYQQIPPPPLFSETDLLYITKTCS